MAILQKTASVWVSSIQIMQVRVQNKGKSVWKSRYDGDVSPAHAPAHALTRTPVPVPVHLPAHAPVRALTCAAVLVPVHMNVSAASLPAPVPARVPVPPLAAWMAVVNRFLTPMPVTSCR